MSQIKAMFSGYSVDDIQKVKKFYGETLGAQAEEDQSIGTLNISIAGGQKVFLYPKENHQPATFTVLNFVVNNIDETVDELTSKGVKFEIYEGFKQDEKGIARSTDPSKGPSIAWFKDPSGNILSIIKG